MKKIATTSTFLIFFMLMLHFGIAQPVFYKGDYHKALAKSKKEGKSLLLLYVSDDCTACTQAESTINSDKEILKLLNKSYVTLKLNAFKDVGYKLAKTHMVREVPSCVYLNNKGEKVLGPLSILNLLANAENCLKILEYRKSLLLRPNDLNIQRQYSILIQQYARNINGADSIASVYSKSLTEEDLRDTIHAKALFELVPLALKYIDINTIASQYLFNNKEWFYAKFGKNETDARLIKIAFASAEQAIDKQDKVLFTKAIAQMEQYPDYYGKTISYKTPIGTNFVDFPNMKYYRYKYLRIIQPMEFNAIERKQIEAIWNNADSLYEFAAGYLGYYTGNKLRITKARDCIRRCIELKNSYSAQYALAAIYYTLELDTEAEQAAILAKSIARETKEDYSDAAVLIDKIRTKRKYRDMQ